MNKKRVSAHHKRWDDFPKTAKPGILASYDRDFYLCLQILYQGING